MGDNAQNTSGHVERRVVPGRNGGTLTPFDSERGRAAIQARLAKKRAVIAAAAQDAVSRGDLRQQYGEQAWLAEVAQTQMAIATTPDAGKSAVMAASWLVDNTGMAEPRGKDGAGAGDTLGALADVLRAASEFAASIPADVVDALVLDVDALDDGA